MVLEFMGGQMLTWLVIGVGDITTRCVLPAILASERSRLAGIVTRKPAKAAPYSVPAFTTLETALRESEAAAVYVASPVFLHASQSVAALRGHRHVLCEKPMALNLAEAEAMVSQARQSQRTFGVAYYRRAYPKVHRAMELIRGGVIGQPVLAWAACHTSLPAANSHRSWLLNPARAGGGPLYDIASHRIDLVNFFFGEPVRVAGQLSNAVHTLQVEDSATLMIEYKNKARGIVDVRWHSQAERDEFRVIGTDGEINLTPLSGPEIVYPGGRENLPAYANVHYPCVRNFVDAALDGAPLLSSGETALWTDWVTERAMASNRASQ
ncbi:MAG: Gfo/Idh/MocA family oxidoreductase [Acidobacteriota bacterium]|nr:Gfo/Idh/MocA family oxidoreductase [Acidobacteriota bacterium]